MCLDLLKDPVPFSVSCLLEFWDVRREYGEYKGKIYRNGI